MSKIPVLAIIFLFALFSMTFSLKSAANPAGAQGPASLAITTTVLPPPGPSPLPPLPNLFLPVIFASQMGPTATPTAPITETPLPPPDNNGAPLVASDTPLPPPVSSRSPETSTETLLPPPSHAEQSS